MNPLLALHPEVEVPYHEQAIVLRRPPLDAPKNVEHRLIAQNGVEVTVPGEKSFLVGRGKEKINKT